MAKAGDTNIGQLEWFDLTVNNASAVAEFYSSVVGWNASETSMGEYSDYTMSPAGSTQALTGICHARGTNSNVPAQWLLYIRVDNVENSVKACIAGGGSVIDGPKSMGQDNFCIIQDPEGAVLALVSALPV